MTPQFRALYREFLLHLIDIEALAPGADSGKLLGQLAAMLAALSFVFSLPAMGFARSRIPPAESWGPEQFLVSTTMMTTALLAVLCWESIFPDRRDILVLAPLPVAVHTMPLAKMAAAASALAATIAALNIFTGFFWPLAIGRGFPELLRALAAHWIVMAAAGAFVFCALLGAQGLAMQLLPRRYFLRVSAFLQLAAFFTALGVYFLEPSLATPARLAAPENQAALQWLPSYWFMGLFGVLNGSANPEVASLARRAATALTIAITASAFAFLLAYTRTLRRIVDEPDIAPSRRSLWTPRFGAPLPTAIVRFSIRTLTRSRRHRMILAGYFGIGLAIALAYSRSLIYGQAGSVREVNAPLLAATAVLMCFAVVGMRAVFSYPLSLRANWIFRVTAVRRPDEYFAAIRRSLLVMSVAPVCAIAAVALFPIWPSDAAAGHVAVLALLGLTVADLRLRGFHKIPFTCSYLPGKANVHVTSGAFTIALIGLSEIGVAIEMRALQGPASLVKLVLVLAAAAIWARRAARPAQEAIQFEESPPADLISMPLRRDGAFPPVNG
jgi:hypothetical protein